MQVDEGLLYGQFTKNQQSGVQKGLVAVLTLCLWTLLAFVETPRCPNGGTALLLFTEAWQSLPTLRWEIEKEQKYGRHIIETSNLYFN